MKLEKIIQLVKCLDADSIIKDSIIEHLENSHLKLEEARMLLIKLESLDAPSEHETLLNEFGRLEDLLYEI